MTPHDDDYLDLVAVLALGALSDAEARVVAAHLETCAECRTLYRELRPVADLVGYATADYPRDELAAARLKARVMGAVREDAARVTSVPGARAAGRSGTPSIAWLGAAAAAIVAVLLGADDLRFRAQADRDFAAQRSQVAVLKDERSVGEAHLATLLAAGNKHFAIPQGEVVTHNGRLIIAMRLPVAPSGKVYQAWTLAKGAKAVAPSITFSPTASGDAFVELPVDASGVAAVAVSIEPAGGSKAPTSTPKFIRKLS